MAIVAAGALVLTGCTSDSGDTGGDNGDGGAEQTGDTGDTGDATGDEDQATETEGAAAGDTAKPDLGDIETQDDEIYYSVGQDEWSGFNAALSSTNSVYNSVINDRMQDSFWYWGTDGTIYPNEDFGTYELVSEDPLTIEYTISDEAVWEDGTPITYDDFLYKWATQNPASLFSGGVGGDDEGEAGSDEDGEGAVFDSVSDSFARYVSEGPQGEPGGKTFTVEYDEPYPDWELVMDYAFPAHVAARESGLEPEELTQAILDGDGDTVRQTAEFYNTGWLSPDQQLPDPSIVPSNGPYSLDGATWDAGQYITLVPNENYYGPPPATARLTFRFAAPETHVQALQNGDINIIEPQATVDTVQQIENMGDQFTLKTGDEMTWEHLDFNFAETSAFSEQNGGLAAREAFALCVPRQQIIDNLIAPINPEAEVMNLREYFPFQDEYDEVVQEAYDGRYDEVDIEAAKEKFAESGLEEGVDIRIGYSAPNQRRTDEVSLIKSSCDQVGFNIVDTGAEDFFQPGGALEVGDFEVALFAWAGSGQISSGQPIYETGGTQNYGQFSSETVDQAWEKVSSTVDPEVHLEQKKIIEKELWDQLYGIPVFAFPGVVAHDASIENVIFNATQTQVAWNAEQWMRQ